MPVVALSHRCLGSFLAAEYCKKLKAERTQMQNEAEILRQEIDSLNVQIRLVWQKRHIEE